MQVKFMFYLDRPRELPAPSYATPGSAGLDLVAAEPVELEAMGGWGSIGTGMAVELPEGYEAQIRPRSGLAYSRGVTVLNSPGTIDSDYRGEIRVLLINHGKDVYRVEAGDRIAQMVVSRIERVTVQVVSRLSLSQTERGGGGFGSSGR